MTDDLFGGKPTTPPLCLKSGDARAYVITRRSLGHDISRWPVLLTSYVPISNREGADRFPPRRSNLQVPPIYLSLGCFLYFYQHLPTWRNSTPNLLGASIK